MVATEVNCCRASCVLICASCKGGGPNRSGLAMPRFKEFTSGAKLSKNNTKLKVKRQVLDDFVFSPALHSGF